MVALGPWVSVAEVRLLPRQCAVSRCTREFETGDCYASVRLARVVSDGSDRDDGIETIETIGTHVFHGGLCLDCIER